MRLASTLLAAGFGLLFSFAAASQSCDSVPLPEANSKAQWYCDTGGDTVIVFVHGFNSSNRTAWLQQEAKTPDHYTYWPKLVLGDETLEGPPKSGKKPSVFLAGFYTGLDSTSFGMRDAAGQLYTALSKSWAGKPSVLDRRNILFVGHSAGGIVTRDMLVRHAKDFAGKRIAILLVASPSKGSRYARDLAPPQGIAQNTFVNELGVESDYLMSLDRAFRTAIGPGGALSEIRGKEIYEHRILDGEVDAEAGWFARIRKSVAETLAATALQERVVERSSAAVYFPEATLIPQSNHSTIAHPKDINHPSHLALRDVYRQMLAARARPCDPPSHLKIVFNMSRLGATGSASALGSTDNPTYQLIQLDRTGDPLRAAPVERDPMSGLYSYPVTEGPFACPGETFWAKLARINATSQLVSAAPAYTDACFRRSRINAQATRALLLCEEGHRCEIDNEIPGIAEACSDIVKVRAPVEAETQHWVVPSLSTLERQSDAVRPGYAEFTIESEPLPGLADATELSFAVRSNGVPIYMDGLAHHLDRVPFNGKGGVHLTFALENLGFTGGTDGYEQIEVELRYYAGKAVIKTALLKLGYVSYRHTLLQSVTDANSEESYQWRALYRPAKVQASYEVVVEHGRLDWIKGRRALFNAGAKTYKAQPVVGVIRPPRTDNPTAGYTAGLKLPTGQIRSLFSKSEADEICQWVMNDAGLDELQRDGAYIFQFPPQAFTDRRDKGKQVGWCRDIPL